MKSEPIRSTSTDMICWIHSFSKPIKLTRSVQSTHKSKKTIQVNKINQSIKTADQTSASFERFRSCLSSIISILQILNPSISSPYFNHLQTNWKHNSGWSADAKSSPLPSGFYHRTKEFNLINSLLQCGRGVCASCSATRFVAV